jgi:hypothetical protein
LNSRALRDAEADTAEDNEEEQKQMEDKLMTTWGEGFQILGKRRGEDDEEDDNKAIPSHLQVDQQLMLSC